MLVWRDLTIICMQRWWLELWRVWYWIPFQGVRTDCPFFFSSFLWVKDAIWAWMPLRTSAFIEELFFDFSVLSCSSLWCSSSLWLLPVSLLLRLVRSWVSICWMLSRLLFEPWKFVHEFSTVDRGHHYRYQPYCTDTLSVRTGLTVAEEAYPLSSSSSSYYWNNPLIGSGEVTVVEEDGCS